MKVIIIGAVAAGAKAAAKLKRLKPNYDVNIYTQEEHISYSSCGMPYFIEGNFVDINKLIIRTPREFEEKGIRVHILHRIEKILPENKTILIKNLKTDEQFSESYDKLVISTGARPIIPSVKGIGLKNIFTLRTIEDCQNIRNQIIKSKKAVIVGGSYIGVELLEAFVNNGIFTTMIEKTHTIMNTFDEEISEKIEESMMLKTPNMIDIIVNDEIEEFIGEDKVEGVKTKRGKTIETDIVILSVGLIPNTELAVDCGIKTGIKNTIKVNKRMETSIRDIYACGDCVEKTNRITKTNLWLPLGSTANKEGRCCALNIAGIEDEFDGILGSGVTKYFDFTMSKTGLTEKTARELGYNPVSVTIVKKDKAGYIPEAKLITLKLIADKIMHRVLGAQAIGFGDADKRINTITTGLLKDIKVEELLEDDITYSPPFSSSIDPIITATQLLVDKLNK